MIACDNQSRQDTGVFLQEIFYKTPGIGGATNDTQVN